MYLKIHVYLNDIVSKKSSGTFEITLIKNNE